jgi:predicted nucleotidyltransferase component of viral defense system
MNPGEIYYQQVQLLVDILPLVGEEKCFALKGGTAINLFVRDMPRLSVDIDLVYLPIEGWQTALQGATLALTRIARRIREAFTGAKVLEAYKHKPEVLRLVVERRQVQIQIELSPVLRGAVFPPEVRSVTSPVETEFGYAEMLVTSLPDLYGGKICAALDRQHPRDWFDVKLLLDAGELDRSIFLGFLVYLLCHPRPIHEVLQPRWKPMGQLFRNEFDGMLKTAAELVDLEASRDGLMERLKTLLSDQDAQFLLSFKRKHPDWSLLPLKDVEALPAVRWKLQNLEKMPATRHAEAVGKLELVLNQILNRL